MVKLTEKLLCLLLCAAIFCGIAVSSSGSSAKAEEVVSSLSAEELAKMPKYDGRDYGIVTPVKDQGTTNLCWAYSSVAAAEASILKSGIDPTATKDSLSLNPTAVAYRVFRRTADPLGNTEISHRRREILFMQQNFFRCGGLPWPVRRRPRTLMKTRLTGLKTRIISPITDPTPTRI